MSEPKKSSTSNSRRGEVPYGRPRELAHWLWSAPALVLIILLIASLGIHRTSRTTTSVHDAREHFGTLADLPGVDHFVQSPIYNRTGLALDADATATVRDIIDDANHRLHQLKAQVAPVANAWARIRIENDLYRLIEPGEKVVKEPDMILVRISSRDGLVKDVYIRPGECAELDVLQSDMNATLRTAREVVAGFFAEYERTINKPTGGS